MNKYARLFNTVKYLKPTQIYYRFYYFARVRIRKTIGFIDSLSKISNTKLLRLDKTISSPVLYKDNEFTFLNLTHKFEKTVEWNFSKYGKLWTYNLSYFDFLNQDNFNVNEGTKLICDFVDKSGVVKDGLEPFPISIRGINWIKFLSYNNLRYQIIDNSLYAQYYVLMDNLEYHILGNHLLENGFSLLFGAYYFQDENLRVKAREILFKELEEQILDDGAHFELSPMYHQIMLFRVLDCVNLLNNNLDSADKDLLEFLQEKASLMLSWLKVITFMDGSIPLLNDSANNIAPKSRQLFEYAFRLNIPIPEVTLIDCGYRKFLNENYECILDIGQIGPDYIPGHAHADTFNFELHVNNKPFIVDTGLSTYETNETRILERSTSSHNTVELDYTNQSEIWASFRVADRAYVTSIEETSHSVKATHDGYKKKFGVLHTREWKFENNTICINDTLSKEHGAIARLHFHPEVDENMIKDYIDLNDLDYSIKDYKYSPEFNLLMEGKVLEIPFTEKLNLKIEI